MLKGAVNGFIKPSTKTEASSRKILIDHRLYDMIHAQPHKSDDEFIIKETYPTYCNHIKAVMKDNGHPELTPHKLRHIFKSDIFRYNINDKGYVLRDRVRKA